MSSDGAHAKKLSIQPALPYECGGEWLVVSLTSARQLLSGPIRTIAQLTPVVIRLDRFEHRKLDAIMAHRSQTTNITGEPEWSVLSGAVLPCFLHPSEFFFHETGTHVAGR
jgi:hypothetical protein